MLEIKHLKKTFGNSTPLVDINCKIEQGEVVTLIGPSGTGKSTLLRCINGLEKTTSGEIIFDGINILNPSTDMNLIRRRIGMIFQNFNLFPHLTVLQNVMVPQMDLLGYSKKEAYDKACTLLMQVGLFDKIDRYPNMLSGGQKQRVAIARTLAMNNEIILLDEPTSALDPTMVGEVENVIQNLISTGKTLIIVTHDMRFAKKVSSRILFMCDGVIYEDGTPTQIFEHPEKEKTRQFIFRIQELTINIDSPYFDFYNCMSEIRQFVSRHYLSYEIAEKICSVFEEIIVIHLIPLMKTNDKICVVLNYSELINQIIFTIKYTDMNFNLDNDLDDISRAILSLRSSSAVYSKINEQDFVNNITIKIEKD